MPITFSKVSYTYNPHSPLEFAALNDVNLQIETGSFTALIGRTGCGKSTLVQQINALLLPSQGEIDVEGILVSGDKKKKLKALQIKELRRKVGLVFQFSESQLFEESVEKDVAFGPKNFGLKDEEALEEAHKALERVGLDASFYKRSPFELSGGEARRVAIAGVLACRPKYLILDEPTAGLDPEGAKEMMGLFQKVHEEGVTILLVTHDMNLVLAYCDTAIVMEEGKIAKIATPSSLFGEDLERYSLEKPLLYSFIDGLLKKGMDLDVSSIKDVESLAKAIKRAKP